MISENSILRRIPVNIDPTQALFIDGIRHAVEIIDLAYSRLRATLTQVALEPPIPAELPRLVPYIFLDAWAIVDAVDRFRMLYLQMPGIHFSQPEPGVETLKELAQPFRDLRNVADHLAQRAEFVIARNSAALGTLTWVTAFKVEPVTLWFCTLRPGTIRTAPEFRQEPFLTTLDWPTDRICLSAGGYEGNLSSILPHIKKRIKHFESQLEGDLGKKEANCAHMASDLLQRQPYQISSTNEIK